MYDKLTFRNKKAGRNNKGMHVGAMKEDCVTMMMMMMMVTAILCKLYTDPS